MTKVHPNSPSPSQSPDLTDGNDKETSLIVWRKSLLFNCKGFTVFDSNGNLCYRVDNYSTASHRHILLMDASGLPLYTIRKKIMSLGDTWQIYDGEERLNPKFSITKHVSLRQAKAIAHVTSCGARKYEIEGSFTQRCCTVYDGRRRAVAEVRRKEAAAAGAVIGGDVFRLVVRFGFDEALAMAVIVLLDQMFGSR